MIVRTCTRKILNKWHAEFSIGNQTFSIECVNKELAIYTSKMLRKALNNYKKWVKNNCL